MAIQKKDRVGMIIFLNYMHRIIQGSSKAKKGIRSRERDTQIFICEDDPIVKQTSKADGVFLCLDVF